MDGKKGKKIIQIHVVYVVDMEIMQMNVILGKRISTQVKINKVAMH